jgi:hypothetical protein
MFGIRMKGKRNYPLIIGIGAAGMLIYLFVAARLVKPSGMPMGMGSAMASPAAVGGGGGASNIAGIAGGTGNFNYPSGIRGVPGGYGISGGYAARSYDAFPYAARLAVA